jgi:PRTRC genetic system protein A
VGITWVWADNGIWKRGVDEQLDVLVRVVAWQPGSSGPGLVNLLPRVRWHNVQRRLPGRFLASILEHARQAVDTQRQIARPIEQMYHIVSDGTRMRVLVPEQDASATHIRYQVPEGVQLLCDLHSHHGLGAYFSATDDGDDLGLSVSAVIGAIFNDQPQIVVRLNCYGQRQPVPALTIFDDLGPFQDARRDMPEGAYAVAHH